MAKKKVMPTNHHPNQPDHKQEAADPEPAMEKRDTAEKLQSLKSLNSLLLKETFDRRKQVESLELSKVELEAELSRSGQEKRTLEAELARAGQRNVEMELERAVVCVFLEAQMGQMAAEFGKSEGEREAEVAGLKREVGELTADLEKQRVVLGEVVRERDSARSECGSWIEKADRVRKKLDEVERARRVLEEGSKKLEVKHERLLWENREGEKALEGARRDKDSIERDLARAAEEIGQLKRKIEGLMRENKDIEVEKSGQKVRIDELEKGVGELNEVVAGLQKEERRLKREVSELGKRCDEAKEKEKDTAREIEALDRKKVEKEASMEALEAERDSLVRRLKKAEKELEDKELLVEQMVREKVEIEEENSCKLKEIAGLNKKVAELRDALLAMELSCRDEKEKNEGMQSEVSSQKDAIDRVLLERDRAQKDLAEERENVKSLKSKVVELEKKIEGTFGKLKKITGEQEELLVRKAEAENKFDILRKEKESVEKRLSDSQRSAEELQAKIKLAGVKSERALIFLKNTASFLSKGESVDEPRAEEDVQPYVKELETIKNVFQLKESVVEELKRQLEILQDSVAKAEKKKGFWTLVSSATTLFAAASVAYLARAR